MRAVANALGANPSPIIISCHRVIRHDGSLGGYSGKGGIKAKRALLSKEGIILIKWTAQRVEPFRLYWQMCYNGVMDVKKIYLNKEYTIKNIKADIDIK